MIKQEPRSGASEGDTSTASELEGQVTKRRLSSAWAACGGEARDTDTADPRPPLPAELGKAQH